MAMKKMACCLASTFVLVGLPYFFHLFMHPFGPEDGTVRFFDGVLEECFWKHLGFVLQESNSTVRIRFENLGDCNWRFPKEFWQIMKRSEKGKQ